MIKFGETFVVECFGTRLCSKISAPVSMFEVGTHLLQHPIASLGLHDKQSQFLGVVLKSFSRIILHYDEDPVTDGLGNQWVKLSDNIFIIPSDVDASRLCGWLGLGTWLMYASEHPIIEPKWDWFDSKAIASVMTKHALPLLIVGCYDSDPWIIGIK